MSKIGLDAVEAIKGLMSADAVLVAGDEQAAVESANRWLSGEGVSGRPYEGYSDACDLAWGGVASQLDRQLMKLRIMSYSCGSFTGPQHSWHCLAC